MAGVMQRTFIGHDKSTSRTGSVTDKFQFPLFNKHIGSVSELQSIFGSFRTPFCSTCRSPSIDSLEDQQPNLHQTTQSQDKREYYHQRLFISRCPFYGVTSVVFICFWVGALWLVAERRYLAGVLLFVCGLTLVLSDIGVVGGIADAFSENVFPIPINPLLAIAIQ
jgi:hypothetical protein